MNQPSRIGIIGLGSIGASVAAQLHAGIPGLALAGVAVGDPVKARERLSNLSIDVPILDIHGLVAASDILVEALPPHAFRDGVEPAIRAGREIIILSAAALLNHWDLVELAQQCRARLILPTGAIVALDAIRAAARGRIDSVTIRSSKPPGGFLGTPYVVANNIDLAGLTAAKCLFAGSVRDGAKAFPTSVNVAVAASLAGIGPDRTTLEIYADPGIERNIHEVILVSDTALFSARIENIPSPTNPRTSSIVAQSAVAALVNRLATLSFG